MTIINEPFEPQSAMESRPPSRLKIFRTGLLITGSALLSGLAVVFWNRKSLATIRQPGAVSKPHTLQDAETE